MVWPCVLSVVVWSTHCIDEGSCKVEEHKAVRLIKLCGREKPLY